MLATRFESVWRITVLIGIFALGAYAQAGGLLPSMLQYWSDVLYLTRQHIQLVVLSGGLAIIIGVPLGILLTRQGFRAYAGIVMQIVNLGTTIPTLAKLAIAMTILGIGTPS